MGAANTPLINYFCYKQSTSVSGNITPVCHPITAIADGGNGQLVLTTDDTSSVDTGTAITVTSTTNYDGNYTVISKTALSLNVSGTFVATETGCWELASNITGANAGDPLDAGQLYFYDNDERDTLKDTYTDRGLTVPNTNPIILDAVGAAPPIYLEDTPYYIEIYDKFNNLVATLEDYLPESDEIEPGSEEIPQNLFPNYGFDDQYNAGDYSVNGLPITQVDHPISSGWQWEIVTTNENESNTYEFVALGDSNLLGNPKNELILRSTGNTTGDVSKKLFVQFGSYQSYQGQTVLLSIYTRLVSGSITDLICQLRRTRDGVYETIITVGSIPIALTRERVLLSFTIPVLTDSGYKNNDSLQFLIELPINQDVEIALTGTWLEQTTNEDVSINEQAISAQAAQRIFARGMRQLARAPAEDVADLPLVTQQAGGNFLQTTGELLLASPQLLQKNRGSIPLDDRTLVAEEPLDNTITTRYLTKGGIYHLAGNSFSISNQTATSFDIATIRSAPSFSTWESFTSAISITSTTGTSNEYFSTSIDAGDENTLILTYLSNYNATTTFNFNYVYITRDHQVLTRGTGYLANAVGNGFGEFTPQFAVNSYTLDYTLGSMFSVTTVQPGSGVTPGIANITFTGLGSATTDLIKGGSETVTRRHQSKHIRYDSIDRAYKNFFSLGEKSYSVMPNPPPLAICFQVDGAITLTPSHIKTFVVNIDSSQMNTSGYLISQMNSALSAGTLYTITVNSIPTNGQYFTISTSNRKINVVYYDTNQTQPTKPDENIGTVYIEFTTSNTIADIVNETAYILSSMIGGIPTESDLQLQSPENLSYFVRI